MARTRHVYPTDEIPHLWMHRTQESARNPGGNLFFEGDTIYSYGHHFPIAKHLVNKHGDKAIAFTTRKYSVTTAKHINQVEQSIPASETVFHVQQVDFRRDELPKIKADLLSQVREHLQAAETRRAEYRRKGDLNAATDALRELEAFGRFYKIRLPKLPVVPQADEKKIREQRETKRVMDAARYARRQAEWERRAKENAIREAEHITQWRAGEYHGYMGHVPAMLRVSGSEIETSRGARFPITHAKRGLALVRSVVARGEEWQSNGHTCHLGHYTLDKIEADGTVHAGCHVVALEEIERVAPEIEAYTEQEITS